MTHNLGRPEYLLSCNDCGTSYHPACIKLSPDKAVRCMDYAWNCPECRKCRECNELVIGETGLCSGATCDFCDRAVHWKCEKGQISKKSKFINCPEHKGNK